MGAAVIAAYSPVLWGDYGFSDDYALLYQAHQDQGELTRLDVGNGRPLMLILHLVGFGLTPDISSLRWLRLLTVLGLAGVALLIARHAVRSGRSAVTAGGLGVVVVSLPTMQVTAAWSLMFVVPPAILLAMWAAERADRPGSMLLPSLALVASVLIYQPGAMCYWLAVAIAVTGPSRERWDRARRLRHATVLATGAVAAAVAWLAGLPLQWNSKRSGLGGSPVAIAEWFVGDILPRAFSPAPISTPPLVLTGMGVFLIAGLLLAEWREPRRFLGLLALLPAAYAPSIVAGVDWPTMRSMTALAPVAAVLYLRAADGFRNVLPRPRWRVAEPGLTVIMATALSAAAFHSTLVYFARPQQTELRLIEAAVLARHIQPGDHVGVVQASWDHYLAPATSWDEFGQLSSTTPWAPVPMVRLIRHEQSGSWAGTVRLTDAPGPGIIELDTVIPARRGSPLTEAFPW